MSLRIALVSQYFWPESFLINDMVKILVAQGHYVEVFTGKPNYPDGQVYEGYAAEGCAAESFGPGVVVHRVPLRPRGSGGAKNLLLNYLSFVLSGLLFFPRTLKDRSFDVVFVFAPSPITSVIPAIYLKWRLKAHLAVWVQDLWPESLSATGFIHNPFLLRVVGWVVRGIYACTDSLLVQSRAFRAPVARYARADKVIYYPNSHQDVPLHPAETTQVPKELLTELERGFCLVFAGNLGTAQSVETLLQVAVRLQHLPDCKLILVGSGSMLGWLEEQKALKGLDNLVLAGRFPPAEMPQFFSRAAGLLVTLKADEIFSYTIPSKVQAYLASGRPIIASLDGEGARIIEEAGAGFSCRAEDAEGMSRCIERLYRMPFTERERLGRAGREYFLEHFEMNRQCQRLGEILKARVSESRGQSK
ncbi:glycosyltransferase WbuB [Metapseudomonas resinovorans]|uniref:glycosyltransferase family 4 protein n=1 Tax=Metapseudomonas resinovorans TaxID=53412 RepID=UPI0009846CA0|nr:glycosyltransferase family 4 protein [Pseudomonas resinovorans]GLZ85870.1 glycosyltransferase WbuB [Pseudomonas resinovorans]